MKKNILYFLIILITLPMAIFFIDQAKQLLSRAAPQPANIIINTQDTIGPIKNNWSAFAQGGEEPPPMLTNVIPKIKQLTPSYIRLDHIYDYYSIVQKKDNTISYDFSKLDKTVDDIIASGALPFFSLSYMPSVFTSSGSVIDPPTNWNDWKDLVKATIEHYSGKNNKNLNNVYYEVWNEPELPQFGGWKLGKEKDYHLLYFYASMAAQEMNNVNNFRLGGPAVGSYYQTWVVNFLSYVIQNNLRLDFYSWHRYSKKPGEYHLDAQKIRKDISSFPKYTNLPLILTEWGIESENGNLNNSNAAAAYTIAAVSSFQNDIYLAFTFEVKDGPPGNGGKWGLFSHEKDQQPLSQKPRVKSFNALNQLKGDKLSLSGEGTHISGLATKSQDTITVILSNFDLSGKNTENVPVTFTGLSPSSYQLKYEYMIEANSGTYEIIATSGSISKNFLMPPNTILLLQLKLFAPLANFIPRTQDKLNDQALILKNIDSPLVFPSPQFRLLPSGSISFDLKPLWEKNDDRSFLIFEAPFSTESGIFNKLFLSKQKMPQGNVLTFGIKREKEEIKVSVSIDDWTTDTWHHLETGWDQGGLFLTVDNKPTVKTQNSLDIRNGKILTFYPIEAAIDNLKVFAGDQEIINKTFNGKVKE